MSKVIDIKSILPDINDAKYSYRNGAGRWVNGRYCPTWEDDASDAFKAEMKRFAKANPGLVKMPKSGNGANIYIGDVHIGSQGKRYFKVSINGHGIHHKMAYCHIDTIEILESAKLVVFNGKVAYQYEN